MSHHIISRVRSRGAVAGLGLAALCLTGCPSMNTYTTARTVPQGTIQHTVALEGLGASVRGATVFVPTLPTYQLRYGLTDRIDIAGRISNLTSIGGDIKFNLLRGGFDLSIDPGFQVTYLGAVSTSSGDSVSLGIAYINIPFLLQLNFSDSFGLILTPGFTYALAYGGATSSLSGDRGVYTSSGALARLGVGVNVRVGNMFALQPEFTTLWNPDTEGFIFNFGIGLQIGSIPRFN